MYVLLLFKVCTCLYCTCCVRQLKESVWGWWGKWQKWRAWPAGWASPQRRTSVLQWVTRAELGTPHSCRLTASSVGMIISRFILSPSQPPLTLELDWGGGEGRRVRSFGIYSTGGKILSIACPFETWWGEKKDAGPAVYMRAPWFTCECLTLLYSSCSLV